MHISNETHSILRGLADQEGQPMLTILDKAIECYRGWRFWEEVEIAASTLRSDPVAWNEELAERRAWETTLSDGLHAE